MIVDRVAIASREAPLLITNDTLICRPQVDTQIILPPSVPTPSSKSPFLGTKKFTLGLFRFSVYIGALLAPLFLTTTGNRATYGLFKTTGIVKKPTIQENPEPTIDEKCNVDTMLKNFPSFPKILQTMQKLNIDPAMLEEYESLNISPISRLEELIRILELHKKELSKSKVDITENEINETINYIKDFIKIDKIIFGEDGFNLECYCNDKSTLNWQLKAIAKTEELATPKNIQLLRSLISVVEYDLRDNNEYYLKVTVDFSKALRLNDETINANNLNIKPLELVFDSTKTKQQKNIFNEPIIIYLANISLAHITSSNQRGNNTTVNSPLVPKDNFLPIAAISLTSSELENILKAAPGKLIFASRLNPGESLHDLTKTLSIPKTIEKIADDTEIVKSYDPENKIVTTVGHYGKITTYSLSDFKDKVKVITVDSSLVPQANSWLGIVLLLSLISSYSAYKGINFTQRRLDPQYLSLGEKYSSLLKNQINLKLILRAHP